MDTQANSPSSYKDRSVGLILFGVGEIVIGGFFLLMVAFMAFALAMAKQMHTVAAQPVESRQLIPAVATYLTLAAFFACMGIGSIRARRWSRTLMLVTSWIMLLVGGVSTAAMAFLLPTILRASFASNPQIYDAAMLQRLDAMIPMMTVVILVICIVFLVGLPGAFVLFYRSPHVKATVEARDPSVPWTDRTPMPVLGLSLMLGYGAVTYAIMSYTTPMLPAFGTFLTGTGGSLGCLVLASWWAVLSVASYRLRPWAWWATLASVVAAGVSAVLSFASGGVIDAYRAIGMSEQQLAIFQQVGFGTSGTAWLAAVVTVPFIGFLVWLRRYYFDPTRS